MVVKIWKNTQNTEKYSGNQEKYILLGKIFTKFRKILKIRKNTQKIQKNTNKYLKNGPHLIFVKKSGKGRKNTPQKWFPENTL